MANPLDPYGDPWGWVPQSWLTPAPLQPGLGVPQQTLDALPVAPQEIEMPAMDVSQPAEIEMPAMDVRQPEPFIGFPRLVEEAPPVPPMPGEQEIEMPAMDVSQPSVLGALQPGLGIPAATVDQAAAPVPAPAQPEPAPLTGLGDERKPEMPVAYMTPDERLEASINLEADREALGRKRRAELLLADEQRANEERAILVSSRENARQAMDQIRAEADRLANETVDADDWYEEGGIGRTVGAVLAAVAGGLVQHLNGGRNIGLDMIDKQIDRFITNRRANIANQRASLGDKMQTVAQQMAQAEQDFREDATFRLAALQRAEQALELEQQNYEPNGTRALKIAAARDELAARRAKADFDNQMAFAKLDAEQQKAALALRKQIDDEKHNRATEKAAQTSAYASLLNAKSSARKTDAEIKALEQENTLRTPEYYEASGLPRPPHEMTAKQYKEWLAARKGGAEAEKAVRENSPEERARQLGTNDLVDTKGAPILFGDGETRRRISKKRGAVDNAARIIDQVLALRAKYGWSSDLFRSPEWQAAQSNAQSLFIELKTDAELGVLAGPDMEILKKMSGGDPTQVRDPAPALKQLRANMVNNLNGVVRAESPPGQTPKRYEPPKLQALENEERDVAQDLQVYNAPEIDAPEVDLGIRKRAAAAAARGVDAMARKIQVNPANLAVIGVLLAKNEQRRAEGLIDDKTAADVAAKLEKRRAQIERELDPTGGTRRTVDKAYNLATSALPPGAR